MFKKITVRLMVMSILAISLSLTTSCKKDDDTTTSENCLVKNMYPDGDTIAFTYNAQGGLLKIIFGKESAGMNAQLEYDKNNRVVKESNYWQNKLESSSIVEYNTQGKWSKVTQSEPGKTETSITIAEYDENGNRVKISNGSAITTYTYSGGNLIKTITAENNSSSSYTSIYEYYTDKENKLVAWEEVFTIGAFEDGGTPSKNLLKKVSSSRSNSTTSSVITYTYEYNAEGFPTKITEKEEGYDINGDGKIDALDTSSYSTLHTYQCK